MNKTKYIILALLLVSVVGASVTNAEIKSAETGPYDSLNGKKMLFYGELIKAIEIKWWNSDNASQFHNESYEAVNLTSYLFTIVKEWNASYIQWSATVTYDGNSNYFEGGFSTIEIQDETDYNKINTSISAVKDELILWFLNNSTYGEKFTNLETDVVKGIDRLLSTYNEGIISEMRTIGLTDKQITQIMSSVDEGFESTLRTQKEQDLKVSQAKTDGYWTGITHMIYFILVVTIATLIIMFVLGRLPFQKPGATKSKTSPESVDIIDLSEFKL